MPQPLCWDRARLTGACSEDFFCICEHFYNDHSCLILFLLYGFSWGIFV